MSAYCCIKLDLLINIEFSIHCKNVQKTDVKIKVEPGYNDIGLCHTPFIASDIVKGKGKLHCACGKIETNEMGRACGAYGEDRSVHRVLVGKPEGKRPLGRLRRRWENNIKVDLQEVGGVRGDWMELAQDRDRWRALVGTVRDFRLP